MAVTEEQPENAESGTRADTRMAKPHRTLTQKWRLISLPNKIIALATVIIACSNFFYTVVALRTLSEIRSSSKDTHDLAVAAGKQAGDTHDLAEAAKGQIAQAQKALDASLAASRLDQRAWVVITPGKEDIKINEPIYLPLEFSNTGKTPAINTQGFIVFMFVGRTDILNFNQQGILPMDFKTLFPNEKRLEHIPLITREDVASEPTPTVLTQPLIGALRVGELSTVVFGKISYRDVFGTSHWMKFCEYVSMPLAPARRLAFLSSSNRARCANYNEIDSNQPKPN